MNYTKILISIACTIALNSFTLKSAFESYALFQKGAQKVLILGDVHACGAAPESQKARLDQQDSEIIYSFIEKTSKMSSKSKFILESSEWYLSHIESYYKLFAYQDLYHSLPYYARENNCLIGTIAFNLADNRSTIVHNLVQIFSLLDSPKYRDPIEFCIAKDHLKELFGEQGTIKDFFKEIEILIELLKTKLENNISSEIGSFLEGMLSKIEKYKKIGKLSFTEEEFKTSYADVFAARFLTSQNINSLFGPLYQWILPLTDNIVDAHFITETIEALKDHNQVILFVGNNHALALHNFLKHLNFETECIQGLTTKSKGPAVFAGPRFDRNNLTNFLSNVFSESSADEQEKQITNCAKCNKANCTKKCSLCKLSYYCSVECQKKNWSSHKLVCKKNNI